MGWGDEHLAGLGGDDAPFAAAGWRGDIDGCAEVYWPSLCGYPTWRLVIHLPILPASLANPSLNASNASASTWLNRPCSSLRIWIACAAWFRMSRVRPLTRPWSEAVHFFVGFFGLWRFMVLLAMDAPFCFRLIGALWIFCGVELDAEGRGCADVGGYGVRMHAWLSVPQRMAGTWFFRGALYRCGS